MSLAERDEPAPLPDDEVTLLEPDGPNAIAMTHSIFGDEWSLWVIQTATTRGYTRYGDWLDNGQISTAVLTSRLTRLVELGIFERVLYRNDPPRYSYVLTRRGRQLWPMLLSMLVWERRWSTTDGGRLPATRHIDCGSVFTPVLTCRSCEQPTEAREIHAEFGPAGTWQRCIPTTPTRRRSRPVDSEDSVAEAMILIGDRWSVSILGAAYLGTHRYGQFVERLGAPPSTVADRLRRFCDAGVFDKFDDTEDQRRGEYRLSEKGTSFYPVFATVLDWGARWFRSPEGAALRLTHDACGEPFHPRLACGTCDRELTGRSVQLV